MPRIVCGWLAAQNQHALDWGWQGVVAVGCQTLVLVVHPGSVAEVQTLEGHILIVTQVRWCRENFAHDGKENAYQLCLASADTGGTIIIWDVVMALQRCSFNDQAKSVLDMEWVPCQDVAKYLILVLYAPCHFVLWNADTGTKIWRKQYTDPLFAFSIDPFEGSRIACLAQSGTILLVDDFSVTQAPTKAGQQFRMSISSQSSLPTPSGSVPDLSDALKRGSFAQKLIRQPFRMVFGGGDRNSRLDDVQPGADEGCMQATFHPAVRHRLILMYSREVLFLDLESLQTVAQVTLDKTYSPLLRVVPCSQRDAVYFFQENGCITLRVLKCRTSLTTETTKVASVDVYNPLELYYEAMCSAESLRITKSYRVAGVVLCPVTERQLMLLMSNGRLLFYELTPGNQGVPVPFTLGECVDERQTSSSRMKFSLRGLHQSLGSAPTIARAVVTFSAPYKQLVAVGTLDGSIQLVNVLTGEIEKDFSIHSCSVRCLVWGDSHQIVSAGYTQTLSSSNVVRNEVFVTDARTGICKPIRPECDETPVEMLRVSHYHSYLAVAFRDQPLEIWDLKGHHLLRRMSRTCPVIVDMAWSCKHHQAKVMKKVGTIDESGIDVLQSSEKQAQTIYRENLVVLDNENHLYHVVVKGVHVRDGKEVNTQWQTNSAVTAMVWKDDYLAFGDSDGKISLWDLNKKQTKMSQTSRTAAKRLQFSHVPGDYTLAVLYADGVGIWDLTKFVCLHQLFSPRDVPSKILDVDLVAPDNIPVVLSADGCLRIFDRSLTQQTAPLKDSFLHKIFCPSLLPPVTSWLLKVVLADGVVQNSLCPNTQFSLDEALKQTSMSSYEREILCDHVSALDDGSSVLARVFNSSTTTADRALLVGGLFGDEWDVLFWSVARHYLQQTNSALPSRFDALVESQAYRQRELSRCAVFDAKRASYDQLGPQIERLVLLGQWDQAVQVLLDTDSAQPEYYTDCLKACLISAVHSSSECQSTVKLVATNLIACGKLSEGIQLLCLIGKHLDACRYLQSYKDWYKAAWLAKVSLNPQDSSEILRKWVDELCTSQVSQKSFAVMLLLSMRQFERVLEILITMRHFVTAAVFLQACEKTDRSDVEPISNSIKEAVYAEYARELNTLGLTPAAIHFCAKAGERGVLLKKEIEILLEDK